MTEDEILRGYNIDPVTLRPIRPRAVQPPLPRQREYRRCPCQTGPITTVLPRVVAMPVPEEVH